ncbi:MAG TPA: YciI family protein [Acidobacteriaceae bacterium]|nr:YciI family protein [Acidobacteriaceae bacterium]
MSASFFLKLIPPRPTFAMDMSADERALMMQHVAYVGEHFKSGKVLIYGPVMAAEGSFGMAVLDVADEAEARALMENDPTVIAKLNTYEISPMHIGGAQGRWG